MDPGRIARLRSGNAIELEALHRVTAHRIGGFAWSRLKPGGLVHEVGGVINGALFAFIQKLGSFDVANHPCPIPRLLACAEYICRKYLDPGSRRMVPCDLDDSTWESVENLDAESSGCEGARSRTTIADDEEATSVALRLAQDLIKTMTDEDLRRVDSFLTDHVPRERRSVRGHRPRLLNQLHELHDNERRRDATTDPRARFSGALAMLILGSHRTLDRMGSVGGTAKKEPRYELYSMVARRVGSIQNPREANCLLLQYHGFKHRNIATILGLTEYTVAKYCSRGSREIRKLQEVSETRNHMEANES